MDRAETELVQHEIPEPLYDVARRACAGGQGLARAPIRGVTAMNPSRGARQRPRRLPYESVNILKNHGYEFEHKSVLGRHIWP